MYEDIKRQFAEVIKYSQNIPNPKVDVLFEKWKKAKSEFIERFGGLIYEWPIEIEFNLDPKDQRIRAADFADSVYDNFRNLELSMFIEENLDTFFENKVSRSSRKDIPVGMKLIKSFKFFEKDKGVLENIQNLASQIIQEDKICGTLCFSVHPLDFLSSSENTYNWRSCHALDGEYRAGNLSYMLDETTFMVYLKGADGVVLPNFPSDVLWNSKKWRMLIHASTDDKLIFAGRQYPFFSKPGMDTVLNIYNNLMAKQNMEKSYSFNFENKYSGWLCDYVDSYVPKNAANLDNVIELRSKYFVFNDYLLDLRKVIVKGKQSLNYNDILNSSLYIYPYYAILNPYSYYNVDKLSPIVIGEEVPCLHCGNELIGDAETMRCDECELKYGYDENDTYGFCDCCNRRIHLDSSLVVRYETLCESCFDQLCFMCDCCGESFYNEEKIFVSHSDDPDCENNGPEWYCTHCYKDYMRRKELED